MKMETATADDEAKTFDYSFDYILAGSRRVPLASVASAAGLSEAGARSAAERNRYTLAKRNDLVWVDDFPGDPDIVVEVMTSSTSGGDKKKRTQVAMAFEDAVKDPRSHNGPGINYRQVWARMVSQLIVKSQVGIAWGGKTIWLVQDVLASHISASTALDLARYLGNRSGQVNILSLGYGDIDSDPPKPLNELTSSEFYSGPIGGGQVGGSDRGFVDIVKVGATPAKDHLWRALFKKAPCGSLSA
jgi:hypothetical protein